MSTTPTPAPATKSALDLLVLAVATTAAAFGIYRAVASFTQKDGEYSVRYQSHSDSNLIDIPGTACARRALSRFEKAIIQDQVYLHD